MKYLHACGIRVFLFAQAATGKIVDPDPPKAYRVNHEVLVDAATAMAWDKPVTLRPPRNFRETFGKLLRCV